MSFKTVQDIINHYQKEPDYMNEDKKAEFKEADRISRYENGIQRKLVDMCIRQNSDPSYRVTPDEEVETEE